MLTFHYLILKRHWEKINKNQFSNIVSQEDIRWEKKVPTHMWKDLINMWITFCDAHFVTILKHHNEHYNRRDNNKNWCVIFVMQYKTWIFVDILKSKFLLRITKFTFKMSVLMFHIKVEKKNLFFDLYYRMQSSILTIKIFDSSYTRIHAIYLLVF